jgi:hypothetical protein
VWEGWKAGFMAFHAFHTLSFPWPAFGAGSECEVSENPVSREVRERKTGSFPVGPSRHGVVVVNLAVGLLLRRRGNVLVEVEITLERRDPLKLPAHALLEGFDFGQPSVRNHYELILRRPLDLVDHDHVNGSLY